jgi:hypothetical protein
VLITDNVVYRSKDTQYGSFSDMVLCFFLIEEQWNCNQQKQK